MKVINVGFIVRNSNGQQRDGTSFILPVSASWYEIIIVAERAQERGYRVFGQRSIIHFSKVRCGMWRDKKSSDDTQFSSFYQIMNDLDPDGMITTES